MYLYSLMMALDWFHATEMYRMWINVYIASEKLGDSLQGIQYIPRNMHTVFALLCFVVVTHWLIFPYPSGLLHWHCGNLTIAPVPAKQPWWIWINTSCEFIMNDCITTTKQSTTKPCAYFLGYTVCVYMGVFHNSFIISGEYNSTQHIYFCTLGGYLVRWCCKCLYEHVVSSCLIRRYVLKFKASVRNINVI